MRTNLPVTQQEVMLKDGEIIVSKTDLQGRITYVNQTFLEISGFTEKELIGEPHNLVRHPDMPPEAFADLWDTLKAGRPWVGLVKNRCKNGDFYWVEAHATPVLENDQVIGYMSVRKKPTRAQVDAHEAAYRLFREKKQGATRIQFGEARNGGELAMKIADTSISKKMVASAVLASLMMIIVGLVGISGMHKAEKSLETVYENRAVPLDQISDIGELISRNRILILDELLFPTPDNIKKRGDELGKNTKEIVKLWEDYSATAVSGQEKELAVTFDAARRKYFDEGLLPAQSAIDAGRLDEARTLYKETISSLNPAVRDTASKLNELHIAEAKSEFERAAARYEIGLVISVVMTLLGIALQVGVTIYIIRSFRRPVEDATRVLEQLSQGMMPGKIDIARNDEVGKLLQVMETWNTRTGFEQAETLRVSNAMSRVKIALDSVSTPVRIADNAGTVIYANRTMTATLKRIEPALKAQNPNFTVDGFVGSSIGNLYADPEAALKRLASLAATAEVDMDIGGLKIKLRTWNIVFFKIK